MALPCIDDSCSITAAINPETRHLTLNAKVAPNGGLLECFDEVSSGLGIEILGRPANEEASDQGFIKLRLSGAGELWVAPEATQIQTFGTNNPRPIPHDGTESLTADAGTNPIIDNDVVNPFASKAIAIVSGTMRVGWTLLPGPPDSELIVAKSGREYLAYHSQIRAQLITAIRDPGVPPTDWPTDIGAGTANARATRIFDIGGMARADKLHQNSRDHSSFVFFEIVPAGKRLYMAARAQHYGQAHDWRTGVNTQLPFGATPDFAERGISAGGRVLWLPLNGTVVN